MSFSFPQSHPTASLLTKASRIIIVGAGVFGLSTAFHLLRRGYTDVTVLDRANKLPAVDAASTDINKVVRSCYSDIFYARLAREAIESWRQPMWNGCYHECGVINIGRDKVDNRLKENDRYLGAPIEELPNAEMVRAKLSSSLVNSSISTTDSGLRSDVHRIGPLTNYTGYFNPVGGWAEATRAVEILLMHVKAMGGRVIPDHEVTSLIRDGSGRTTGVKCSDGACFGGDKVILTIGSWTASTFPELELDSKCLATGQCVATIQLSVEEKERYKGTYVLLDFDSGLYTFPDEDFYLIRGRFVPTKPTESGTVKFAIHTAGHTHMITSSQISNDINHVSARKISTPRTITSHPELGDGLRVPRTALLTLRELIRKVYPELAEKPLSGTRMCWYTDSPDGNWVIGPFPGDPTLFLATSGSGHAFKFLPNIGRLIVDSLEGKLDPGTAARFAVDRDMVGATNGERASVVTQELDEEDLCGPEE